MRFWVGWLSDGQSLESPADEKSCLKSGFQERRLRLAPRREEAAGGKWRELVVGRAAAAHAEGGGARAARARVRAYVRACAHASLTPPTESRRHPSAPWTPEAAADSRFRHLSSQTRSPPLSSPEVSAQRKSFRPDSGRAEAVQPEAPLPRPSAGSRRGRAGAVRLRRSCGRGVGPGAGP